jgi:acyl-CoA thioesterase I
MAAACGGGGDSDNPSPPSPPPNVPGPTPPGEPPPAPAPVANSVAKVKQDGTGSHEARPNGVPTVGPAPGAQIAPTGTVALGGYGELYTAPLHAATNTRVQLRNFETYAWRKSTSKWTRIQFSERVDGAAYQVNYTGVGVAANVRNEPTGGVSVKPAAGTVYRFWPESGLAGFKQAPLPPNAVAYDDVGAVFTTVQARLIADSSAGADDRSRAQMVVSTAVDWIDMSHRNLYASDLPAPVDVLAGTPIGIGKLLLAGNDWRAMNFHSATAAQVDALGLAQEGGGTPPLANSSQAEPPRAKRVIVIGDSISEGGSGQDSFRRPLWNALVTDPSNPLVDFVGTREGIRGIGGTCAADLPSTAFPLVPDFDLQHQSYWGWCVEDVTAVLPSALAMLAAPQVDRLPDIVLVHLGTNDIVQDSQAPSLIRTDLENLVKALRAANPAIHVLLAQLIPNQGNAAQIGTLNQQIASLATQLNTTASPVTAVDQSAGFDPIADLHDGLHPDESGEQKMAAKWWTALKPLTQ